MKITCESCGAKYTIADEKVRGRRVKVRCKSCGTAIVVDGSQPLSAYEEATDEATHVMQSPPSFSDSGAPPADPDLWSVNLSDTDQRDMTTAQIVEGWRSGLVTEDAFVWKEGMADWMPVLEVGELALAFGSSQPGSATPAIPTFGRIGAAPEAARVQPVRTQSADLFGAIHTAGSEAEARQAAAPASSPYSEPKPTGARNENSVLFSLDALKAGFGSGPSAAAAPKPSASTQARPSEKADINALMGMGGGGGGPLFGMSANQALMTAPAPPPERTPASVPPAAHSARYGAAPARSNRTMLIGIGVGAIAVVAVILVLILHHGGSNKAVAASDQSATPADSAKPNDSAANSAASAEVAAKASASAPPAASSAPPANLPPFNKAEAIKALGIADKEAKACKKAGGPTGTGKVIITFDTSGKITKADVEGGHYPGSDVGKCVADAFLKVQIPAFSGKSITAARHFEIP
jgi:predicted Zn finger-like uncharacterized protein